MTETISLASKKSLSAEDSEKSAESRERSESVCLDMLERSALVRDKVTSKIKSANRARNYQMRQAEFMNRVTFPKTVFLDRAARLAEWRHERTQAKLDGSFEGRTYQFFRGIGQYIRFVNWVMDKHYTHKEAVRRWHSGDKWQARLSKNLASRKERIDNVDRKHKERLDAIKKYQERLIEMKVQAEVKRIEREEKKRKEKSITAEMTFEERSSRLAFSTRDKERIRKQAIEKLAGQQHAIKE